MSENSFRKIADESIQPQEFKFSKLNLDKAVNIKKIIHLIILKVQLCLY